MDKDQSLFRKTDKFENGHLARLGREDPDARPVPHEKLDVPDGGRLFAADADGEVPLRAWDHVLILEAIGLLNCGFSDMRGKSGGPLDDEGRVDHGVSVLDGLWASNKPSKDGSSSVEGIDARAFDTAEVRVDLTGGILLDGEARFLRYLHTELEFDPDDISYDRPRFDGYLMDSPPKYPALNVNRQWTEGGASKDEWSLGYDSDTLFQKSCHESVVGKAMGDDVFEKITEGEDVEVKYMAADGTERTKRERRKTVSFEKVEAVADAADRLCGRVLYRVFGWGAYARSGRVEWDEEAGGFAVRTPEGGVVHEVAYVGYTGSTECTEPDESGAYSCVYDAKQYVGGTYELHSPFVEGAVRQITVETAWSVRQGPEGPVTTVTGYRKFPTYTKAMGEQAYISNYGSLHGIPAEVSVVSATGIFTGLATAYEKPEWDRDWPGTRFTSVRSVEVPFEIKRHSYTVGDHTLYDIAFEVNGSRLPSAPENLEMCGLSTYHDVDCSELTCNYIIVGFVVKSPF